MASLIRHLHAFIGEVTLTDEEWQTGIEFLTRTGQITDERRQEFIRLSDVLGASMLTIGVNQPADPKVAESTVFGPFFLPESPSIELGGDLAQGAPGQPCWVTGSVRGASGESIAGARLDVWGADEDGLYDVQHPVVRTANRGHLIADGQGRFSFWSIRPTAYPIPIDGPAGQLLAAFGRSPMRPAHLHFMVSAPGWRTLVTHLFTAGDPYLGTDAVFGVKDSLVVQFLEHSEAESPPGLPPGERWSSVAYDFVLPAAVPPPGESRGSGPISASSAPGSE